MRNGGTMSSRTTHTTVTFVHPFSLKGLDGPQAAGTYVVRTDEELVEGVSFPAYRRVATAILIPTRSGGRGSLQVIGTDPDELGAAAAADRARGVEPAAVSSTSYNPVGRTEGSQTGGGRLSRWNLFRSGPIRR